jgi:hypothetical protein
MKELCLPPGNLGRMVSSAKARICTHSPVGRRGGPGLCRTDQPRTPDSAAAVPAKPGAGGAITTLAARRLPRPAGLPAAYQIRSSLPRSGCLTSDTVVNPPVPNSPWVCILTDSVWVPAANVTVSWPNTSGST